MYIWALAILFLNALAIVLFFNLSARRGQEPVDQLELWMSYDEVKRILPHDPDKLMRAGLRYDYVLTENEQKVMPVFGLNLEREYGVTLAFNQSRELVLINRIQRAATGFEGMNRSNHED